jgi:hypothetical protein
MVREASTPTTGPPSAAAAKSRVKFPGTQRAHEQFGAGRPPQPLVDHRQRAGGHEPLPPAAPGRIVVAEDVEVPAFRRAGRARQ